MKIIRLSLCCFLVGSALVASAQCTQYYVTGGGTACNGQSVMVGLDGAYSMVQYQLYKNGDAYLNPKVGLNETPPVSWQVSEAGIYTISIYGECDDLEMNGSVEVFVPSAPQVSLISNPTGTNFCAGQTISFSATGANQYAWTMAQGSGEQAPFVDNIPQLTNAPAGTYHVVVTGTNSCGATDSDEVTVTVAPQVSSFQPNGPTSPLCQDPANSNFSVTLNSVPGATAITGWALEPPQAGEITGSGTSISVNWSSTYYPTVYVKATASGCGGPVVGSRPVTFIQSLNTNLSGNNVTCTNQTYTLTVNNPDPSTSVVYSIYKGPALFHEFTHPLTDYTWPAGEDGVYTLQANTKTCPGDQVSGLVTVTRSTGPEIALIQSPIGEEFCEGTQLAFSASGSTTGYTWKVGTNEVTEQVPDIGDVPGIYPVEVKGYNSCGILKSAVTTITINAKVAGPFQPSGPTSALCQNPANSDFSVTLSSIPGKAISITGWALDPPGAGTISGSGTSISVDWSSTYYPTVYVKATAAGCGGSSVVGSRPVSFIQSRTTTLSGNNVTCTNQTYTLTINNPDPSTSVVYSIYKGPALYHEFTHPLTDYTWPAGPDGVYTLQSNTKTCPGDEVSGSVTVTRTSGPEITISQAPQDETVCQDTELVYSAGGSTTGYTWTVNDAPIVGDLPGLGGVPGYYTVQVTGYNSCGISKSAYTSVTIDPKVTGPFQPNGPSSPLCQNPANSGFSVTLNSIPGKATSITGWALDPPAAGTISGSGTSISVDWSSTYYPTVYVKATAAGCGGSSVVGSRPVSFIQSLNTTLSGNNVTCTNQTYTLTVNNPDPSTSIVYSIYKGLALFHEFTHPLTDYTWPAGPDGIYTLQSNTTTCPGDQVSGSVGVSRSTGPPILLIQNPIGEEFCEETDVAFSASGSTGYAWKVNNVEVTEGTPDLDGVPGDYIVEVSGFNSCGILKSAHADIKIISDVHQLPVVTGDPTTCANSTSYSVTADAPATFTWSVSPGESHTGISATGANATVSWVSTFAGTATVKATAHGCATSKQGNGTTLRKVPNELSISSATSSTICNGTQVALTASGGTSYTWTRTTGGSPSTQNPLAESPSTSTQYTVQGPEESCLTTKSKSISIQVDDTSFGGVARSTISHKSLNFIDTRNYETAFVEGKVGSVVRWEYKIGSSTWNQLSQSASISSPQTSLITAYGQQVQFKAIVKNGVCPIVESAPVTYRWGGEDQNYVRAFAPQEKILTSGKIDSLADDIEKVSIVTEYFDGLGRSAQKLNHRASPTGMDMVQPRLYDSLGMETVSYLPYTTAENRGYFKDSVIVKQHDFYQSPPTGVVTDSAPYARTRVEISPLRRILEQGSPGAAWQPGTNHTIKKTYELNIQADSILLFRHQAQSGEIYLEPGVSSFYVPGVLYSRGTVDEDNKVVKEFTDKQGRTICKKVYLSSTIKASTYYVYDDFGNLVVVLPPEAIKKVISDL